MKFYVTFGWRYAREPHPSFPEAHPDGWLAIEASSYEEAWAAANKAAGLEWCFMYTDDDFDPRKFPRGELASVVTPT